MFINASFVAVKVCIYYINSLDVSIIKNFSFYLFFISFDSMDRFAADVFPFCSQYRLLRNSPCRLVLVVCRYRVVGYKNRDDRTWEFRIVYILHSNCSFLLIQCRCSSKIPMQLVHNLLCSFHHLSN